MENNQSMSLTHKSKRSFSIQQDESSLLNHEQKQISAKDFIQSCPYRIENIDRDAIIKHQNLEACLKRLSTRNDVQGVTIATLDGHILYEYNSLRNWVPVLTPLCSFARHLVRDHDPQDNIQALRLRTKNYEILITIQNEQLLIVMKENTKEENGK